MPFICVFQTRFRSFYFSLFSYIETFYFQDIVVHRRYFLYFCNLNQLFRIKKNDINSYLHKYAICYMQQQ